jgi:hypothetical protein
VEPEQVPRGGAVHARLRLGDEEAGRVEPRLRHPLVEVGPGHPALLGVARERLGVERQERLLVAAGLGLGEVVLYVESDNAAAIAVYSGLGFTHDERDTHVMYRRG